MKRRRLELHNTSYLDRPSKIDPDAKKKDDFYARWYAKFGEPKTRTLPGDEFMARLKEMIEFE